MVLNEMLVSIDTSLGAIVAEIHTERAKITALNFLRYVDEGLYRDAAFYRSLRPENGQGLRVIQGGVDPSCRHPPLPPIAHETTAVTGLSHVAGALSAARWETGTAASEFFIVLDDSPDLDCGGRYEEGYAVFGRVIAGMAVVSAINSLDTTRATAIEYLKGQAIAPVPMRVARL